MTDERSTSSHLPRRLFGVQRQAAVEAIAAARQRAEDAEERLAATEQQLAETQQRADETQERISSLESSVQELVEKARKRAREFEERLRERERELADYRGREAVVGAALIQAEKIAQDTTMAARSEAEEILAAARSRAEEMVADAERRRDDILEFAESVRLRCRNLLAGTIGELERDVEPVARPDERDPGGAEGARVERISPSFSHPGPARAPAQGHTAPPPRGQELPERRPSADAGGRSLETSPPGDRMMELDCGPISSPADVEDLERRIALLDGVKGVRVRSHDGGRVTFIVGVDGAGPDLDPLLADGAELEAASQDRIVLNFVAG